MQGPENGKGGPRSPSEHVTESNENRDRTPRERTDRSIVRQELAERTYPAAARNAGPATVIGNRWPEHARAAVEAVHGRLFGRHASVAPAPGGTEWRASPMVTARAPGPMTEVATAKMPSTPTASPENRITVETASLDENARRTHIEVQRSDATRNPVTPDASRRAVDHVYEKAGKAAARERMNSAFAQTERELGRKASASAEREVSAMTGKGATTAGKPVKVDKDKEALAPGIDPTD
jgi:hypothetical protein